jgi:hypothetical protein
VHPTAGILRVFKHFAWLEARSVKVAFSRPAHQRVTQAVGCLSLVHRLNSMKSTRQKTIDEKTVFSEYQASLREEYRECSEKIGRLDSLIWQTASVILPITLAGFTFFGLSTNHTPEQFFVVVITGIGSMALLISWYMLSRNWYFYQLIAFYRIREIEAELGLWHFRYALFLRKPRKERLSMLEQMKGEEKERFENVAKNQPNIPRIGLNRTMTRLTLLFLLGWIALIVREYLLSF